MVQTISSCVALNVLIYTYIHWFAKAKETIFTGKNIAKPPLFLYHMSDASMEYEP